MFLSPSEITHLGSWFDSHLPGSLANSDNVIIMQYIGHLDRGRYRIYEGDILINSKGEKGTVIFYEAGFYLKCYRKHERIIFIPITGGFLINKSVIGNIHENPELLKGVDNG